MSYDTPSKDNNSHGIDEKEEPCLLGRIEQDLLQISLDRSKLHAFGPRPTSSGAPSLRTAHRGNVREANELCKLRRVTDCERLNLPCYSEKPKPSKVASPPSCINKRSIPINQPSDSVAIAATCLEKQSTKLLKSIGKERNDSKAKHEGVSPLARVHTGRDASSTALPSQRRVNEPLYRVITAFPQRQGGLTKVETDGTDDRLHAQELRNSNNA